MHPGLGPGELYTYLRGVMAEQQITLNPGESREVTFEATPTVAKTYQVSVDGLTGSFVAIPRPTEIVVLRPIGAGAQTQLIPIGDSPNWRCVDDVTPDDMKTCVRSISGSKTVDRVGDLYILSAFPYSSAVINWVQFWIRCHMTGGDFPGVDYALGGVSFRTHNTKYPFAPGEGMTTDPYVPWGEEVGWVSGFEQFTTNPYTGLPWTVAELNELQAGVWLWGRNVYRYCTQFEVKVSLTRL